MSVIMQYRTILQNRHTFVITGILVTLLILNLSKIHPPLLLGSHGVIRVDDYHGAIRFDDYSDAQPVTNDMDSAKGSSAYTNHFPVVTDLNVTECNFRDVTSNSSRKFPSSVNCTGRSTNENGSNCTDVQFEPFSYVLPYTKAAVYPPPGEECKKRLPRALVVGVQKCGTSALLYFLSQHPGVSAVLEPTEVNYFSRNFNSKNLDWYRDTMNCSYSNQIAMEKSPSYFYCGLCPARVKQMNPDMKIIITVKDPIVRALSQHAMNSNAHPNIKGHFEDCVIDQQTGAINTRNIFIKNSMYPYFFRSWLQEFSLSQIHFVDGHNLEANPAAELNLVEQFLDVGNYFTCDMFVYNPTKGKYCVKTHTGTSCLRKGKGREHEEVSQSTIEKLRDFFRPMNEQFFALANRRFDWGY